MKRVIVPLAPGFEEIEVMSIVDILRRAGTEVVLAGTVEGAITGANSVKVLADTTLDDVWMEDFDMVILPGGNEGTENLKKDDRVLELVSSHQKADKYITAICAAPVVLKAAGVIEGKRLTSYPSVQAEFEAENYSEDRVVVDGKMVTSRGPGTAVEFAIKLVEILHGKDTAEQLTNGVLARV